MARPLRVTLIGSLPPHRGVSPYVCSLARALASHEDVALDVLSFSSLYPRRLYPGGDPATAGGPQETIAGVRVRRILSWWNPITPIAAATPRTVSPEPPASPIEPPAAAQTGENPIGGLPSTGSGPSQGGSDVTQLLLVLAIAGFALVAPSVWRGRRSASSSSSTVGLMKASASRSRPSRRLISGDSV